MTTVWLDGKLNIEPLTRTLRSLQQQVGEYTEKATLEALEKIHEKAMENLYSNVIWGTSMGTEWEDESIQHPDNVKYHVKKEGDIYRGTIEYTSPHARLQEYGGFYIYSRDKDLIPMPIGLREGHVEYMGYTIVGDIQGKFFLTSAIMNEARSVKDIFGKYMVQLASVAQR